MIKTNNLQRVRIMDVFLVISNIKDYAEKEDLETLKLKDFFEQKFIPAFEKFDLSLTPSKQKELTKKIHSLDSNRATNIKGLYAHLRSLVNFPDKNIAEASIRLKNTIDSFGKSIHNLPLAEETAVVINLLQELDQPNSKTDINLVGVKKWIDEIRKANNELHTLFKERINKEATVEVGKSKASREVMQKVLADFCNRINALALLEGEEPYRTLIDNINREIERAKQVKKQRTSAAKASTLIDTSYQSDAK